MTPAYLDTSAITTTISATEVPHLPFSPAAPSVNDTSTSQHKPSLSQNGSVPQTNGVAAHSRRASSQSFNRKHRKPSLNHVFAIHHQEKTSCLSSGASPQPNFVGFRNLAILVILVSNLRLMILNFRKYGVLICLRCHDYSRQDVLYGSMLFMAVPCHLLVAYVIELVAAQQVRSAIGRAKKDSDTKIELRDKLSTERQVIKNWWLLIAFSHAVNATLNLMIASVVVYKYIYHPGIGTICELHAVVVWLKTCSYALTNRDLRHARLAPQNTLASQVPPLYASLPYPQNITLRNLGYFWWAPTLVYQPVYPRSSKIRWSFVIRCLVEMVSLSIAIWIAFAQYAVPLLRNSLPIISTLDFPSFLERLMKLSTISLFCWLAGFYALFQSGLNLLAELTMFGDREFYGDWWNSSTLKDYWISWNKPVHAFFKRHMYVPLVERGVPPMLAQVIVFLFSGLLHEALVGIPTHNVIGVAFLGMLAQLPLIFLTDLLQRSAKFTAGPVIGNMIFWVSFVLVGQPLAAMLYFFAWQEKYGSVRRPDFGQWTGKK
ncbi:MAG: hypothetical protein M1828_004155 [Chrysothrix sp. TS-e1954]|nr:MAG: hypothetical protein M1828_004155 [Chrysothrix sp. TS-e1954]